MVIRAAMVYVVPTMFRPFLPSKTLFWSPVRFLVLQLTLGLLVCSHSIASEGATTTSVPKLFQETVADTKFSVNRGFFEEPFEVAIATQTPDAEIRFTTNGSPPTETNGQVYQGPIPIAGTTVLRAAAFKPGYNPTNVDTQTYLFLDDVIRQPNMDRAVVDSPAYSGIIKEALRSIPTLSVVMDAADMFGVDGVYHSDTEKGGSVELIDPEGREGFQIDCAIERHSNASPKTSLRLKFKREFGPAKLRYPLFESAPLHSDSAVDEFDRIILRSGKNQSWTSGRFKDLVTYVEDQWVRDSQIAMSGVGSHGTFVHFYINGVYWGLYNPAERPDAWFMSAHEGNEREDYFSTNFNITEGHGDHLYGDPARFDRMMELATAKDLEDPENYAEFGSLVDLEDYADYVILFWFCGFGDGVNNNWYAGNRNTPPGPFRFFMWDGEFIFLTTASPSGYVSAWVPPYFFNNSLAYTPIVRVWQALYATSDFRILFADRVYKHCFNGGALTDANSRKRLEVLAESIEDAVIGESARWGGGRTRNNQWRSAVAVLDGKMAGNVQVFMNALSGREGLYPQVDPPVFNQHGGRVSPGFELTINGLGTIYYSLDGQDPRLPGGSLSPNARIYGQPIELTRNSHVMARVLAGGEWSARAAARFVVHPPADYLRITEIMYHPPDPPMGDPEAEFVELRNIGAPVLDLEGIRFTKGIEFEFPAFQIGRNQCVLVARNRAAFQARYGTLANVAGEYAKKLNNAGERIRLEDSAGETILDFRYEDHWFPSTDGGGYSLVHRDPVGAAPGSWGDKQIWRPSRYPGGIPAISLSPNLVPDGIVDTKDLLDFLDRRRGWVSEHPPDFNYDDAIDLLDLMSVQIHWHQVTSP